MSVLMKQMVGETDARVAELQSKIAKQRAEIQQLQGMCRQLREDKAMLLADLKKARETK